MALFHSVPPAAVAIALWVSPAAALTAEEVWADWQRLTRPGSAEIIATTRREGDRLVLTDIRLPFGNASDAGQLRLERIDLQDLPDGRVAVLVPARFPVVIDGDDGSPKGPELVTLMASAPDFSMIISDIGDKAEFEVDAPSLVLALEKVEPVPRANERIDMNLAIADLTVRHKMSLSQPTETVASSLRIGTLHGDMLVDVEDSAQDKVEVTLDLSDLSWLLEVVLPETMKQGPLARPDETANPLPDILKGLAEGMTVKAELAHGPFALKADVDTAVEAMKLEFTSASGKGSASFDAATASYDIAMGKTAVSVIGGPPEVEFRNVSMSVAELGYGASVGIGDLTSPQDVRFVAKFVDLVLPPEVWAQADPTGAFGASPLTFVLELAGRYALGPEMLEPDWAPIPGAFPPVDIIDATLSKLLISGFDVTLAGDGSLGFDETDLVTYEGIPAPEGKISFRATGVNALIDRVIAAGLVPQDELTGFRFGLAFIAKPGPEPDSLVSEVEFRDKNFFLNGLRLR